MIEAGSLLPDQCEPLSQLPLFWRLGKLSTSELPAIWPMDYLRGVVIQMGVKAAPMADRLLENWLLQLLLQSPPHFLKITLCDPGLQSRYPHLESIHGQTHGQAMHLIGGRQLVAEHVALLIDKARNRQVTLARERLPDWQSCLAARRTTEPVDLLVLAGLWADPELLRNLRELCVSGGALGILPVVLMGSMPNRNLTAAQQQEVDEILSEIRGQALVLAVNKEGLLEIQDSRLPPVADLLHFFTPKVETYPDKAYRQAVTRAVAQLQASPEPEQRVDFLHIPVGRYRGRPYHFTLGEVSHVHHALIGGATHSGKTSFLQLLVTRICQRLQPEQLRLFLFDYKDGFSFGLFGELAHVARLHQEHRSLAALLQTLDEFTAEMTCRAAMFHELGRGISSIDAYNEIAVKPLPRWLLVVDEIQGAFDCAGSAGPALQSALRDLMRRGASFGMHAVFTTQSCTDSRLDAATRAQMRLKAAFRPGNSEESGALFGRLNEAALSMPPFQAMFNASDGDAEGNRRVQVDYLPEIPDLAQALDELRERFPMTPTAGEISP